MMKPNPTLDMHRIDIERHGECEWCNKYNLRAFKHVI